MKNKIVVLILIFSLICIALPLSIQADGFNDKKMVYIEGRCGSYGFGSFVHIGKIWWCPNYPISFGFSPENLYTFEINGIPQEINMSLEGLQIDMNNFFGVAPTLIDYIFLPPRTIFVYGICDEVTVREFK